MKRTAPISTYADYRPWRAQQRLRRSYRTPSLIVPGVYIGNYKQIFDARMLAERKITHLLCTSQSMRVRDDDMACAHAPLDDRGRTDLSAVFEKAFSFIDKALSTGGSVLVYCRQGVNRSPTVVMGWLMKNKQWTLKQAYEYVQAKRPQAWPHERYFAKLSEYERQLHGRNSYTAETAPKSMQQEMREAAKAAADGAEVETENGAVA